MKRDAAFKGGTVERDEENEPTHHPLSPLAVPVDSTVVSSRRKENSRFVRHPPCVPGGPPHSQAIAPFHLIAGSKLDRVAGLNWTL